MNTPLKLCGCVCVCVCTCAYEYRTLGSVPDDGHGGGVVFILVDPHDKHGGIGGWGGDHHALSPTMDMSLGERGHTQDKVKTMERLAHNYEHE